MVVVAAEDAGQLAEAQRVAIAAVIAVSRAPVPPRPADSASSPHRRLGVEVRWRPDRPSTRLPSVSIIVPVHNRVDYTDACLKALVGTIPRGLTAQVIVVDDASTDDTSSMLDVWMATDKRIAIMRNEERLGFIASCNRGAEAATGEVLVFLNNAAVPQEGWLLALLRTFRDYPDAGAVGGKLIYPDGRLQEAGALVLADGTVKSLGRGAVEADAPRFNYVREVDYCSGALLSTWRSLFLALGGFDVHFRSTYYEDVDYCLSVRQRGYRVYYQPECVVVHHEWGSAGSDALSKVKMLQTENLPRFVEKWRHLLASQPLPDARDGISAPPLAVLHGQVEGAVAN